MDPDLIHKYRMKTLRRVCARFNTGIRQPFMFDGETYEFPEMRYEAYNNIFIRPIRPPNKRIPVKYNDFRQLTVENLIEAILSSIHDE